MSQPKLSDLEQLYHLAVMHDDEAYHSFFDAMLEARLMELDPEFMNALRQRYEQSGMTR